MQQNKGPAKLTEDMLEHAVDIPDTASVPKLSNTFNRSSAVRLKTEDIKTTLSDSEDRTSSPKLLAKRTPEVTPNGHIVTTQESSDTIVSNEGNSDSCPESTVNSGETEAISGDSASPPSSEQASPEEDGEKVVCNTVNGEEKTLTAVSSPISIEATTDTAETDSIGDVLEGELPYNKDLKESK